MHKPVQDQRLQVVNVGRGDQANRIWPWLLSMHDTSMAFVANTRESSDSFDNNCSRL